MERTFCRGRRMMAKGKWVFLVDKLPTEVAPPALSLHYAVPWPVENKREDKSFQKTCNKLRALLQRCSFVDEQALKETDASALWDFLENKEVFDFVANNDPILLVRVHEDTRSSAALENRRLKGAMQIKFAGENIRIFPEEFSDITPERMREYLDFYVFHETDLWSGLGLKPKDPDEKFIYEALLLDGCDEYQANNILNGGNFASIDDFPAPLGWYECPKEYGLNFKSEEELTPRYRGE